MASLFQKFQEAVKVLGRSPTLAKNGRQLQFQADINRLFLYTCYNRLGKNAGEDAEEIIGMASKASLSEQEKQVQENIHEQEEVLLLSTVVLDLLLVVPLHYLIILVIILFHHICMMCSWRLVVGPLRRYVADSKMRVSDSDSQRISGFTSFDCKVLFNTLDNMQRR